MVFQDPSDAFFPKNYRLIKRSELDRKARELLRMVELPEEYAERYPHNMSVGQRQRVGIARTLFSVDMDFEKPIESIESEAPSPLDVPAGCPFQDRCDKCRAICRRERPELKEVELSPVLRR